MREVLCIAPNYVALPYIKVEVLARKASGWHLRYPSGIEIWVSPSRIQIVDPKRYLTQWCRCTKHCVAKKLGHQCASANMED